MKKIIFPFLLVFMFIMTLFSCSEDEVVLTNSNCYISSFTLGTIKRTLHTTSSTGEDSTYVAVYSGSYYAMNIDQNSLTISNSDSLPKESHVNSILVTVSGEGDVFYKEADNPAASWYPYSTTDSVNFSKPLIFLVMSTDGTASKEYTVKVNVHQQEGNEFSWNKVGDTDVLEEMKDTRAFLLNDRLCVIGRVEETVCLAETGSNDGRNWDRMQTVGCEGGDLETLRILGGVLYMNTSDGVLLKSTDGLNWNECGSGIRKLLAVDDKSLYALVQGEMCRSVDGQTWVAEDLDDDVQRLPLRDIASVYYKQENGNGRVMLIGNREPESFPADRSALVWGKTLVPSVPDSKSWIYYIVAPDNKYVCPQLENLVLLRYNNALIALGGASLDGTAHETLDAFYVSSDNGITWQADAVLTPPSSLKGASGAVSAVVDEEQYIWLLCGRQVWKGRLNVLGFEQ